MKALVTITDLTRMGGQRVCVAGYLPDGTCVRPELRRGNWTEEWLRVEERVAVRPFAVVEFDLQERTPNPPHTEDWIIEPTYRVTGMLAPDEQKFLLVRICDKDVQSIFGASIHRTSGGSGFIQSGQGKRSLGTIVPASILQVSFDLLDAERGARWDYRLEFTDQSGVRYRLAVVDLACRCFLDHLRDQERMAPHEAAQRLTTALQKAQMFLRIGLARNWGAARSQCFLQVTGVYSYPDYLTGRCFADLR